MDVFILQKSNGDYEQVLAWANDDNYNIDGHCCSDNTDGTPFIYHINSPTTWTFSMLSLVITIWLK